MSLSSKYEKMTTQSVEKLILTLATPTIFSMLVSSFYNMADTYFVGGIGTSATAAVGVVYSVMTILQAFGFFYGHGSGNFMSRSMGAKKIDQAKIMASTAFFYSFLTGILLGVLGLIFVEPLSFLLGSTTTIHPYTVSYLSIILIGAPFLCASCTLNNQLRMQGSANFAMIGIVSGAIINIALDPLFIFYFDMGIAGAALATTISQIISFSLLLWGTYRNDNIAILKKNIKPSTYMFQNIITGGLPSLARQGFMSIGNVVLNTICRGYGDSLIAAVSIVARITGFVYSIMVGFGQGFQPVCGFNLGAKKYKRVLDSFWFCVKFGAIFLLITSIGLYVFSDELVTVFQSDNLEVIELGSKMLKACSIVLVLNSFVVLCNMLLQVSSKTLPASILAVAKQGICFIPIILIMSYFFGIEGILISQAMADVGAFILAFPLTYGTLKFLNNERMRENEK